MKRFLAAASTAVLAVIAISTHVPPYSIHPHPSASVPAFIGEACRAGL